MEIFGTIGETFDPNIHNAVMHTEEEGTPENTITQVFQKGFKLGDKIVRFAMVQVANWIDNWKLTMDTEGVCCADLYKWLPKEIP